MKMGALIAVPHMNEIKSIYLEGRKLTFLSQNQIWVGVLPNTSTALFVIYTKPGEYSHVPVKVLTTPLDSANDLRLPASVWKKVQKKTDEDQIKRDEIRSLITRRSGSPPLSCWQTPIKSRISSRFASPRRLPNGRSYRHTGEDRSAQVGTPIKASASGRVAYVGETIVSGRIVILEHGDGFFSRYLHLKEANVRPGQMVHMGEVIALSGASGRVEAPHLHWEILWQGIPADPDRFLQAWEHLCGPPSA